MYTCANPTDYKERMKFCVEDFSEAALPVEREGVWYADTHTDGVVNFILLDGRSIGGSESFVFEVVGPIDDSEMAIFNSALANTERMNYLKSVGCGLEFVGPAKETARVNLIKCGGMEMPAIVGGMLKEFYYENSTSRTTMEDCVTYLAKNDVVGYGFEDLEATYRGKIAQLLLCTFTGMRLGTPWNGRQAVNGGYIVVKKDGDVVAFHSTIADEFKDFLVAKMVMECPSHSRHKDMVIYKQDGRYYLKLGLQLRFILNR